MLQTNKQKNDSFATALEKKVAGFNFKNWLYENRIFIIILISLVFCVYFNSFHNEFVSDDIAGIRDNPNLGKLSFIFSSPLTFLRSLPIFLIDRLFGPDPFPFRLLGIAFHLATVLALYLLIYILSDGLTAKITALIFSVHPILIEGVAWISGSLHAQYSFFVILALIFYIFSLKNKRFYWFSVISFLAGLFTSEKAIVFPFILIAFHFAFKETFKDKRKLILPLIIGSVFVIVFLFAIPQRLSSLENQNPQSTQTLNPLTQIPIAITSYLGLIFWPKGLTLYHSEMIFNTTNFAFRVIIFILFLASIVFSRKKNRFVFFWFCFFIIALSPTLTPFGISWIVAERYVYLGSIGIITVFAMFYKKLLEKERIKTFAIIVLCVIVGGLSARTIIRNNDWRNQDNLWLAAAKTSPSSPQNHNNLGDLYGRQGNFQQAALEFIKAIELNPNYADAYHNLANTYLRINEPDLAIQHYLKAVEINPNLWQSFQDLSLIYFNKNDYIKAKEMMEKAVGLNPNNAYLHLNMGVIYQKNNEQEKAALEFKRALELDPQVEKYFTK